MFGIFQVIFSLRFWTVIDIWANFKYAGSNLKKNGKYLPTPDSSRNRKCFFTYQEKTWLNKYSCSYLKQNWFLKRWNILNNRNIMICRKIWEWQKNKIFLADHSKLSTCSSPLQQVKYVIYFWNLHYTCYEPKRLTTSLKMLRQMKTI